MSHKKIDVDDTLKTAQILRNEGLFEDAKHTLRKLISQYPEERRARDELEEIQREELTLIMKEVQTGQRRARSRLTPPPKIRVEDPESIIQKLVRDLNLGDIQIDKEPSFIMNVDRLEPKDEIDVGIGLLQMGSYQSAITRFRNVIHTLRGAEAESPELLVSAMELLATAHVESGHAFDAILFLETALADNSIPAKLKLGLMYWMARAHQKSGQKEIAGMWFSEVMKRDSEYRDTEYRLRTLFAGASS